MYGKAFLLLILPTITAQRCTDSTRTNFEWEFEFDQKTYYHGCDFLTNANQQTNAKRQMNWCNERVVNEKSNRNREVLVKNMCRKACDNCDDNDNDNYYPNDNDNYYPPSDPSCTDSPRKWRDSKGNACVWYEEGGNRRCDNFGSRWEYDGKVADEVCCACGGGRSGQNNDNNDSCTDIRNFRDSKGNSCEWYNEYRCDNFGNKRAGRNGKTANDACCECGGGNYYDVVTSVA